MTDKKKQPKQMIAAIHANFHFNVNGEEPLSGEILRAEQIQALERFVRWHERQVAIGKEMLVRLQKDVAAEAPAVEGAPA